ncbi:2-hydroxyacid dehydrogenase [Oceanithermus sp.]
MKLAVLEGTSPRLLAGLDPQVEVVYFPARGEPAAEALEAEFLVATRQFMTGYLSRMPRLRVVQTISAGVDWIRPHVPPGVILADGRGVHDVAVSEWVLAAILAQLKLVPEFARAQGERRWLGSERLDELYGKRVLLLGYGAIGRATAARLRPFGVRITPVARRRRPGVRGLDELPGLLPAADVVVLLLPLTEETRGLVNGRFLELLPEGALLVNAGRGGLVDQQALLAALRAGRLRASLDVTEPEPLPPDHPLWGAPGLWISPHRAAIVPRLRRRGYALVREQVRRYLAGEPLLNVVVDSY